MASKLRDKVMYWKSQPWSSCTLEGCTMYYGTCDIILLVIVAMDKEGFAFCFATSSIFDVEEEG